VGFALFAVAVVAALGAWVYVAWQARAALWRQVADKTGLTMGPGFRLSGTLDGATITVEPRHYGMTTYAQRTWTRVAARRPGVPEMSAVTEDLAGKLVQLALRPDVRTGDDRFDQAVLLDGDEARIVALLDPARRTRLETFLHDGGMFERGEAVWWTFGIPRTAEALESQLRRVTAESAAFVFDGDPAEQLWERVRDDDEQTDVRIQALRVLCTRFPAIGNRFARAVASQSGLPDALRDAGRALGQ
jgi:hypothetical protein